MERRPLQLSKVMARRKHWVASCTPYFATRTPYFAARTPLTIAI